MKRVGQVYVAEKKGSTNPVILDPATILRLLYFLGGYASQGSSL